MEETIKRMLACQRFAVAGATNKQHKFGYQIFQHLRARGYEVTPVHPALDAVDGVACYPSVLALPEPSPEVVCCVTPPAATLKIVEQCADRGVMYVWMQPGASSPEAVALCAQKGIDCVHDQCVMLLSPS